MDFGTQSRVQEARRAATPKFFGSSRVARAFRLAVEHRDWFWLSRVFTWCCMLGVCCYDLVRRFRNTLCTANWLKWCWVQSQWGRVLCSPVVAWLYVSGRARPRCGVWVSRVGLAVKNWKASLWGLLESCEHGSEMKCVEKIAEYLNYACRHHRFRIFFYCYNLV